MKNLIIFGLVWVLAACGNPDGEYLGKWVNTKNANDTLEITHNGTNYLVKETLPSFFKKGESDISNIPAVLKDGLLQVQTGVGAINIGHVKESDTLTMGGSVEYKRLK